MTAVGKSISSMSEAESAAHGRHVAKDAESAAVEHRRRVLGIDELADIEREFGPAEPELDGGSIAAADADLREYDARSRSGRRFVVRAPDDARPGDIVGPDGEREYVLERRGHRLVTIPGGDAW